jgi:hypothetical protein
MRKVKYPTSIDNSTLSKNLPSYHCLKPALRDKPNSLRDDRNRSDERCQTLTYYGLSKEQISEFFENGRPKGVDRVVPMGKSMDFTLVWDGYDLIRQLSRKITVL